MRVERLVWVMGRFAIVGVSAWTLVACSSKNHYPDASTSNGQDAGPLPCAVTSAAAPSCNIVVEAVAIDAGDAGDLDAAADDAAPPDDAGAPDAAIYDGDGSCPIVTASEITCAGNDQVAGEEIVVAAGNDGEAYATIVGQIGTTTSYGSQLAELHSDGSGTIDLEPVAKASRLRALPVVGAGGSPGIVTERASLDLEYYAQANGSWNAEKIPGSVADDESLFDAASAADGTIFALLASDYMHATVASRGASGGWTSAATIATASPGTSALAVDTDGMPYVLGWGEGDTTFFLAAGNTPPASFPSPDSSPGGLTLAIGGAPGSTKQPIALRMDDTDSVLDVYPLGNPTGNRFVGGETSSTCSGFTIGIDCSGCAVGSKCDTYADQIQAYAMATTGDGTVWLAYIDESVDIHAVVDVENDPIFLGCYCSTVTQSTSLVSTTLVITPLGLHGEPTGVTMRIPFDPNVGAAKVAMAANGSILHFLVTGTSTISHAAIDTSKIPRSF